MQPQLSRHPPVSAPTQIWGSWLGLPWSSSHPTPAVLDGSWPLCPSQEPFFLPYKAPNQAQN